MNDAQVASALAEIHAEADVSLKNFRVAALLSELFRAEGMDPVVVGGSAVEFYTEGTYVSGDIDLCFAGTLLPKAAQRAAVMARVGAQALSSRKFLVAGVYVDLLGAVETGARTPFQEVATVKLQPVEDLVAERVFAAFSFPAHNPEQEAVARTLLRAVLAGQVEADQAEMRRLATSADYGVGEQLARLTREVAAEINGTRPGR